MLQTLLVVLLLAAPVAAAVGFAIGGVVQVRRRDHLAREAHEAGLLFSAEDLFDVSRRYAGGALIGGGHSARAANVTYGRLEGLPVRAFDFRYEVGHGTRRQGRHYAVVAVETLIPLRPLLLWHRRDAEAAPLVVRRGAEQRGEWYCQGDAAAQALAALPEALVQRATGVEVLASAELLDAASTALLVWAPVRKGGAYGMALADVVAFATALAGRAPATPPPRRWRKRAAES